MGFRIHKGTWQFQKADGTYESRYRLNDQGTLVTTDAEGNISGAFSTAVEWNSVTGKPTNLSSFTNDLGNYGNFFTTSGGTISGSYTIADASDNNRLYKGGSWLNPKDPWGNYHIKAASGGMYIDASTHRIRPQDGSTDWLYINSSGASFSGTVTSGGNMYAPRYYDSNDGNYFLDPAGTSYLNDLRVNVIYDRNNTGYYVDPASTSNLNSLYTSSVYTTSVTGDYYYQQAHGNPRNNLGSPTVTEMALFNEQFNNKTAFLDPSRVTVWTQQNDGEAWQDITGNYSQDSIRKFIAGYDSSSNIYIPNGVFKFRIEVTHPNYVFANAVYFYWSSDSHSTKLHLWARRTDNNEWYQRTSSDTSVSSWPGHLYMPFSSVAWHPTASTTSHYNALRFEFIPNWSGHATYGDRNINLYKMQVWGGYPAGTRYPYSVNEYGDFTAIRDVYASKFVDKDNTGYYLDPVNTSNLLDVTARNITTSGTLSTQFQTYFSGQTSQLNVENQSSFARFAFNKLDFYDWQWGSMLTLENGTVSTNGTVVATNFVDYNDTNYYVNPATDARLRHLYVGDVAGSNDGSWNARMKVIGSSHARFDVVSNSDGIITTMYSHTGHGAGKVGTYSNHPLKFIIAGSDKATLDSSGNLSLTGSLSATGYNSSNWDTAYSWGNHGSAGYATTSYVTTQINNLINGAPGALNTLDELALALGDDANFATNVTNSIAAKLPLSGGTMSGDLIIGTSSNSATTSAYGDFTQLRFDNLHNDTNRGPNKIVMHDNGGSWIGGFGIHSNTVSYYTGGFHRWYKTNSQTSSSQVMQLDSSGNLTITGTLSASGYNKSNWDTAYGWGNHASAGYAAASHTHNYLTAAAGSEQQVDLRFAKWNQGGRTMNTDPRWNESGYDGDLGCLHIWSHTAAGASYGRAGIALFNGGAYQYLTTKGGSTGLYVNNQEIIHAGIIGNQSVNYASSAGSVAWNNVSGKPSTFSPSSHTHSINEVTGLQSALDSKPVKQDGNRYSTDWNNILSSGFYNGEGTPANSPVSYGQLIVAKGIDTALQIAGGYSNDNLFFRGQGYGPEANGFYPWRKVIHDGNIGSQSVSYANSAGSLSSMNISQFTNNSGYITSNNATGSNGNFYIDDNYGYGIVGTYSATRYQGIWAMGESYKLPADGTTPGSLYGLAWTYNPDYGGAGNNAQAKAGLNHQLLLMMNGRTYTALGAGIWTDGTITTTSHGTSANWNTAYGWGNHASAGYLTSLPSHSHSSISSSAGDITIGSATWGKNNGEANVAGQVYNGQSGDSRFMFHSGAGVVNVYTDGNFYAVEGTQKVATETWVANRGYLTSVPAQSWVSITGKPTNLSSFTNDLGNYGSWITASHLNDYTNGAYRVIADYSGQNTWYIRSSGQFIWGNGHDWTQSFRLNLSQNGTDNGTWAFFGQQDSNTTNGRYRGVRIRKYASGAVDGDLSAGAYYIGDTQVISGSRFIGTADSASSVAWGNVSGKPTNLSSFTNDLGNYGGWLTTSGKAADSNLLDGLDSSRFLYTTSGQFSGDWNTLTDGDQEIRLVEVHNITGGAHSNYPTGIYTYGSVLGWQLNNATFKMYASHTGDIAMQTGWNNDGYSGWMNVITSRNIGSQSVNYANSAGSAGNADTVDGYHESAFWRNDQTRTIKVLNFTGVGTDSGNGTEPTGYGIYQQGGAWTYPYPDLCIGYHTGIKIGAHYSYGGTRFYNNSDWATEIFSVGNGDSNVRVTNNLYIGSAGGWITDLLNGKQAAGSYAAASHNHDGVYATAAQGAKADTALQSLPAHNHDGVYLPIGGKAADSNLLDGLDLHTGRNNEANKVVRTDVNGYIQAGWINTPSGATTSTLTKIYASQDDYIRYVTPSEFRRQITDGVYQPAGSYAASSHTHTPSQVGLGNVSNAAQVTTAYNSSLNSDSRNSRGVTRLYRRDDNSDFSVQTYWTGARWRLYGYQGDSNHADTHVGYADSAGSASSASTASALNTGTIYTSGDNLYVRSLPNGLRIHHNSSVGVFDYKGELRYRNQDGIDHGRFMDYDYWTMRLSLNVSPWDDNNGLGTDGGACTLAVDADGKPAAIRHHGAIEEVSDARQKVQILPITNAVDKVKQITGSTFYLKSATTRSAGVIAQDVLAAFPEASGGSEETAYTVNYNALVGLLMEAVKEQQATIEELQTRIQNLENK